MRSEGGLVTPHESCQECSSTEFEEVDADDLNDLSDHADWADGETDGPEAESAVPEANE
ncbi:hypothetical protein [Halomarina oriensis]|nr:hypothetical protein [Halomarina oriensis]